MTVRVTPAFDAIHANISHLPAHGVKAGYTTGSDGTNGTVDIRWRTSDWIDHPGAIHICQDAGATDHTADWLDVERGAATLDDLGPWCRRALTSFHAVERPGQRMPAIYQSASLVPAVVRRLREDGVKGVFLVVANWNLDDAQATKDVEDASGDYPVVGIQWRSGDFYDTDVMSVPWLDNVSHVAPTPQPGPFLHILNGKVSLNEFAAARGTSGLDILALSAKHYTPADVSTLLGLTAPAGTPVYTHRP